MWTTTNPLRKLKRGNKGVSNVIVVALGLVILVIVTSNVIFWSYQMNQLDWERMQENLEVTAHAAAEGVQLTFSNRGALTCHIIGVWIVSSTAHQRYEVDIFVNAGETWNYTRSDITLSPNSYIIKAVTERGNIAISRAPEEF